MTAKRPLISIVTVVFNGEHFIGKTLTSLKNQNFDDYEYIVVDGGSIDNTLKAIEASGVNVTQLISEKDNGIYDAMNKAIALASGEWIAFLNAGDQFVDNVLSTSAKILREPAIDILYGDVFIDKDGLLELDEARDISLLNHDLPFCHQSTFVRSGILKQLRFSDNYKICADYDFFLRAAKSGARFKKVNFPIAIFEYGGISSGLSSRYFKEKIAILYKNHSNLIDKAKYILKFIKMLIPINRQVLQNFFSRNSA